MGSRIGVPWTEQEMRMIRQRPTEWEAPLVYALDRRGPNDPRFGSFHLVLAALLITLAALLGYAI